ncbi:disease resistance protein RLM3-like isoform X2 [Prosopis cineraria]|uniref:disease resistance protein RLM3-like isoform X2 n=1 Tax=Prosopis cineraria TaxID=364024 RepID=UPI00240F31C0|nr:disease resistance protein RLM3-like isoform X2 [Prosopis cineraria]
MAYSSSSNITPPPPLFPKLSGENYDVFLSFRGEDTRYSFTSHLHAALTRLKVRTYIDYELQRGDEISPALLKAIEEAKVAVVVFSQNYASSRWCLDELVKIMDCKRSKGQIVVPIFYHIEPTHVRNQTGSYADSFAQHDRRLMGSNPNKVLSWRMESELVERIAMDVLQKLDSINNGGIESRIATYKQMAQAKLEKCLRSGNLSDMEDLTETLQELANLKLDKALRTDDDRDWEELDVTNQRILQLKQQKFIRSPCNPKAMEDYTATQRQIAQINAERENRRRGLYRGI